jgi:hypothetical protein
MGMGAILIPEGTYMNCRIPSCSGRTSRWGIYCNAHKARNRRHGHPLQETITAAALGPFAKAVGTRRSRNPQSEAWRILDARWFALMDCCQRCVDGYLAGVPTLRHHVQAAKELLTVGQQVEAHRAIDVVMAMYLFHHARPRSFKSDVAFVHQVVRRVRGLADVNAGSWFDPSTGRTKRVYRDLPPRATVEMGAMLVKAFGAAGLQMVRLQHRDDEQNRAEAQALHQAMESLS